MEQEDDTYVKILFRFYSDLFEQEIVETMWATKVDESKGLYKLDNIPFYASNIASGDVVFAEYDATEERITYRKTVEHSGNSTIHVIIMDDNVHINTVRDMFKEIGCVSERMNDTYFAMEVPAAVNYKAVKAKLLELEASNTLGYNESCLAKGHVDSTK